MNPSDIATFGVLLMLSALFSGSESALTSVNEIRVKSLARDGRRTAQILEELLSDRSRLISALLIGNNIVNVALTAFATIVFTEAFATSFGVSPEYAVALSTTSTVIFLLIFGEVLPKTLGVNMPMPYSMLVAWPIYIVRQLLTPLTISLAGLQNLILRIFRHDPDESSVTSHEIKYMAKLAEEQAVIGQVGGGAIARLVHLHDLRTRELLTPRIDIVGVPIEADLDEVLRIVHSSQFTRLPVYNGDIDDIIGFLHIRDIFLLKEEERAAFKLEEYIRPPIFVPEQKRADDLLLHMRKEKAHIAVVVDEYGGTSGLVTLEDLLEEVVGEIQDEYDLVYAGPEVTRLTPGVVSLAAACSMADLEKAFDAKLPESRDVNTIAGLFMREYGRIPDEGDRVLFEGIELIVHRMRGQRILRLLARLAPADALAEAEAKASSQQNGKITPRSESAAKDKRDTDASGRIDAQEVVDSRAAGGA